MRVLQLRIGVFKRFLLSIKASFFEVSIGKLIPWEYAKALNDHSFPLVITVRHTVHYFL